MKFVHMYKIALLNIECFPSSAAIERIIAEHKDQIKLVVASDRYKGRNGGIIRQAKDNFFRSGFPFTHYLALHFLYHPLALSIVAFLNRFLGFRLQRKSLNRSCELAGVPFVKTADINSPEMLSLLREHEIDLIAVFYFDQILKKNIISIPKHGVINFHPAILPNCRGLFPVVFSAVKNNGAFGMTVHDIEDESIDAGPILAQATIETPVTKSILRLEQAVNLAGVKLFRDVIHDLPELRSKSQHQNGGAYYSYPSRADLRKLKELEFRLTSTKDFVLHYCEKESESENREEIG